MSAETVAAEKGLAAVQPGMPVETFGLRQDWTVLALTVLDTGEGVRPTGLLLAVRPHAFHAYVIELVSVDRNVLVAWQGTYHPTLAEAVRTYVQRGGRIDRARS